MKSQALGTLAFLLISFCAAACRQEPYQPEETTVPLWGRWETRLTALEPPPAEVEISVELIAPSGKKITVAGVWDGGSEWLARFMPDEEGVWIHRSSATPPVEGLDGQVSAFRCAKAANPANPLAEHGPIRVSGDGTHFVHADGTPWFWLADTAWNGALLSQQEDWDAYLSDRVLKGFSAVQFVATQWRAGYADAAGLTAYSGFDEIEIHPEFFHRLDQRIDAINAKGLVAAPVLLWVPGEEERSPGKLPVEQAIRLARYMVARYAAHQVIWFVGGDAAYDGEHVERWKRIGRALFGGVPHAPALLHPRGMHWPWELYQGEDWLDAFPYQSGHGDNGEALRWIHSGPPARQWNRLTPPRPIINLEPPYEDHIAYQSRERHGAYNVRRAVYWSLLNTPTAGVTYGAHGVWSWASEPGVPLNHERTGEARPWREAMALPGSGHMKHMITLFRSLPWWKLRPAPQLLAAQPGDADPARFISAARTTDGSTAVLYLPVGGTVQLNAQALGEGFGKASWYDPRTGEAAAATARPDGGYSAPDGNDWVLVLSNFWSL